MRRLAITSAKGGVGKTTVALNLALAFADRGTRTLLVDTDPQGGVGHSLARGDVELPGLADVLAGERIATDVLLPTKHPSLTLLPRGRLAPYDVAAFELALARTPTLDELLEEVASDFDLAIIDTPAGLGLVSRAVLRDADFVLLPFQAEPLALRSIVQSLEVLRHVKSAENPRLELAGILPTMVARHQEASQEVMTEIWSGFEGVLDSSIPRADVFVTASRRGVPLAFLGGPRSPESRRFDVLAAELDAVMNRLDPKEGAHAQLAERSLL